MKRFRTCPSHSTERLADGVILPIIPYATEQPSLSQHFDGLGYKESLIFSASRAKMADVKYGTTCIQAHRITFYRSSSP